MRVLADKLADEAAWLEARRSVVTASEVATIVRGGAAREALLAQKRSGEWVDLSNVPAIRHGKAREPVLAAWATARFGVEVSEVLTHAPGNPRHAATPDLVGVDSVVELKTGNRPWAENPAADRYRDQVQWQMYCTDRALGVIVYEHHDDGTPVDFEPTVEVVHLDLARRVELVAAADAFLADLDSDAPTPVFDAELDAMGREYLDALEREKTASGAKRSVWARMQDATAEGESRTQESDGARVTVSVTTKTRTVVDEAAARESNPELAAMWDALIEAHTTTTTETVRGLTVTRPKEAK